MRSRHWGARCGASSRTARCNWRCCSRPNSSCFKGRSGNGLPDQRSACSGQSMRGCMAVQRQLTVAESAPVVARLLAVARVQGGLTDNDILEAFPRPELHIAEVDQLYAALQAEGIHIVAAPMEVAADRAIGVAGALRKLRH